MKSLARFAALLLLAAGIYWGQTKPTVVFVCEHGSAKSVIAAMEFKRLAAEKGLDVTVLSRGTNPDAAIPPLVRNGLKADGLDVGALKPTKVSETDLKGATRIISFGPDLSPFNKDRHAVADWSATPSPSENYDAARDYIRKQLELLVKELKQ